MASQPIILPSIQFKSKSDAKVFFKDMLNRYHDGNEVNSIDDQFLFEVIQLHPDSKEKIGVGIKRFYREKSKSHPTSCFHLERYDGSTTDFSVPSCISSKKPTVEQAFYQACRTAVTQKLIIKKEEIFKNGVVKCYKTGEVVNIKESEYRHTTPRFRDTVRDFVQEFNIDITRDLFVESEDMQYVTEFVEASLSSKFENYHAMRANLEVFKKYER